MPGETEPDDDSRHDRHAAHEAAGATWWIEGIHPWRYGSRGDPHQTWPTQRMLDRISAGP